MGGQGDNEAEGQPQEFVLGPVRDNGALNAAAATLSEGRVLTSYEKSALRRAMTAVGAQAEPRPTGKRIRKFVIVNQAVFDPKDRWLSWLNSFHVTTRPYVIAREIMIDAGELWDPVRVEEARRRLTVEAFSTLVVAIPIKAPQSEQDVDVLVVTRDVWSLRLNSDFRFEGGRLRWLRLEPSENNFWGRRKQVSAVYTQDLGRLTLGPHYQDPNLYGTRWSLDVQGGVHVNRATRSTEGGMC